MIAEQISVKLRDAANSVLEMMCSAPVLADEEFPPAGSVDPILMGLHFVGEVKGRFAMAVDRATAAALAEGFLGMSDPLERQQIVEVLGELANMLCGHFLGQLHYVESFNLSSPKELDLATVRRASESRCGHSYQRSVHLSSGILSMNVEIDPRAR